ncbi:hypothetical protein V6N13_101940 [Hibiscus sabdariffa]
MHKPLQRNLARYRELGNGVIGSTAQAFPCPSADHARGIRYPRPLCHLQYPRRVFKSSAKDSTPPLGGNYASGRHARLVRRACYAHDTCPWGAKGPYCGSAIGRRGACVASSPDSDLEAFSHNPAHGSFAPLAFQPSAMTNCANQRFLSY